MTLHILSVFKGLTVLDIVTTDTETKFYLMSTKDIAFSDLCTIKEQLHDIKEIIVYTHGFKQSPNDEECDMEIIVENKEKIESAHLPRNSDSIKTDNKRFST